MIAMSEQINELAASLAKAQAEIENASKNAKNPHFKSDYANLAEILNTSRPILSKFGLAVSQCPSYESGIVTVETILMHCSGQWLKSALSAPVAKQDAQGVGSAVTYCRRYSLAAVVGIAQEDDDAEHAIGRGNAPAPKQEQRKAAKEQHTGMSKEEHERLTAEFKELRGYIHVAASIDELDAIMVSEEYARQPEAGKKALNGEYEKRKGVL